MDNIEGEDKFGTAPVRNAYFALCSTQLTGNLEAVSSFTQVNQYPSPMNALQSEWGAIGNLRFLISSIGSSSANASSLSANVYNIFCVGMEAYACIEQDGYSAAFIYRKGVAVLKSLLIDLELWLTDNRAEGASHRERLSEETFKIA
jgi:N4-gp56 family major capsid protein